MRSSDQVNLPRDPDGKDYLLVRVPSSPVWEAGGPEVSTGLPEELGGWGSLGDFLPFPVIFFKICFIGVVCRSEHVEGRGSELKISRMNPSHHPIERPCQSWKAGGRIFRLEI